MHFSNPLMTIKLKNMKKLKYKVTYYSKISGYIVE